MDSECMRIILDMLNGSAESLSDPKWRSGLAKNDDELDARLISED